MNMDRVANLQKKKKKHTHKFTERETLRQLGLKKMLTEDNVDHCNQANPAGMDSQPYTDGSDDITQSKQINHSRDIILKQIYESSSVTKGGLKECIGKALGFRQESDYATTSTTSMVCFQFGEERNRYPATEDAETESFCNRNTELCKREFSDIIHSKDFAELCNVILHNLDGVKVDRVFDFSVIDSRLQDGSYEKFDVLFYYDIQEMWANLENVGMKLVTIARNLKSRTHQMKGSVQGIPSDGKFECPNKESTEELRSEMFLGEAKKTESVQEMNASTGSNEARNFPNCNVCHLEVKSQHESIMCGNFSCPCKYYHTNCLASKQLQLYGPCWYCPSCLCQICLIDQDDEKIILCDGCDQGFHIYCTQPPLDTVPVGKWFCAKCQEKVKDSRKARRAYLRKQRRESAKEKKNLELNRQNCYICHQEIWGDLDSGPDGKFCCTNCDELGENVRKPKRRFQRKQMAVVQESKSNDDGNCGGFDLLLAAAKTVNLEESLASLAMNS